MPSIALFAGSAVVSTNASQIGSQACTEVLVQAHVSNTVLLLVGTDSAQTLQLSAGNAITLPVSNVSQVQAATSAGSATVNWIAHTMQLR